MNEFSQLNLSLVLNSDLVKSIDQIKIEGIRLLCCWVHLFKKLR